MSNEIPEVHQIRTPEGRTTGVYANSLGISISPLDFTLDFYVSLTEEQGALPDGQSVLILPQEVVARIWVNPSLVWRIARDLTDALQLYEDRFGAVRDFTDYETMDSPTIATEEDDESQE